MRLSSSNSGLAFNPGMYRHHTGHMWAVSGTIDALMMKHT